MKTFATLPCLVIALTLLGSACSGDEGVSSGDADGACVEACDEGPSLLDALPPTTVISTLNKTSSSPFASSGRPSTATSSTFKPTPRSTAQPRGSISSSKRALTSRPARRSERPVSKLQESSLALSSCSACPFK